MDEPMGQTHTRHRDSEIILVNNPSVDPPVRFPLYLMKINEEQKFLSMQQAGVIYDSGWDKVEIVGLVLEANFSVRPITAEERNQIREIADKYSSSK
jgi:hypothetical protein